MSQEKQEDPKKIGDYKTNKVCFNFSSKLKIAAPESGPLFSSDSKIGLNLTDYNAKPSVYVQENITIAQLYELFEESKMRRSNYEFSGNTVKVFGNPDAKGLSIARILTIKREAKTSSGEVRKLPWYISIENGYAEKIVNANGSSYMKGGTYKKEKAAAFNLSDGDMFAMVFEAVQKVECMKIAFAKEHEEANIQAAIVYEQQWKKNAPSAPHTTPASTQTTQPNPIAPNKNVSASNNTKSTPPVANKETGADKKDASVSGMTPSVKRMLVRFLSTLSEYGEDLLYAEIEALAKEGAPGKKGTLWIEKSVLDASKRLPEIEKAMDEKGLISIVYRMETEENTQFVYFVQ